MTAQMKGPRGNHWPRIITSGSSSVKIYEVDHPTNASGKAYVLAWRTPTGRKTQKFAKPDAAIVEGRIKASQLAAGRIEGAEMSRGDRDELQAARKMVEGLPLLSALEEWAQARQLTAGNVLAAAKAWAAKNGKVETRTKVADVVKKFLKAKTAAGKNVAKDHHHTFSLITSDLGEFTIDTVSSRQLDIWLAKAENPVTRNTRRKRLVSLWRWAQRKGYLSRDAHTEAEMTERAHEPAPVIGIIDVHTWRSLLAHFRDHNKELMPALVLAGFCGMRRTEIHSQTWEDISLDRKILRVTKAKRGTPARRLVPLCDAAIEWLMHCNHRKGDVCQGLAIDAIRRIGQEGEAKLPDNCFRHSYISHAVAATGNIPRVSLDAGNSPKEINRHYRELVSEAEGKAWFDSAPDKLGETISFKKTSNA